MDFSHFKLGRIRPPAEKLVKLVSIASYMNLAELPKAPPSHSWSTPVGSWPMYDNDLIGDCTAAGYAHMEQCWSKNAGGEYVEPPIDQVVDFYKATSGYDGTPATDQGADEITVLNYARKVGMAGHKIQAYGGVNPLDAAIVNLSIYLFGGLYLGLALPVTAQNQTTWSVVDAGDDSMPGSWGGHCVPVLDYFANGDLLCVTWGTTLQMTRAFFEKYTDQAYALLSPNWLNARGISPSGFDDARLDSDLETLAAA